MVFPRRMNNMSKYAIEIFYSEEDEGYIAVVPELPGCSAFGDSEESALREIKLAMDLWVKTAKAEGREIPKPQGKDLLNIFLKNNSKSLPSQKVGS
jgi:predicted RNase H-like HicB family nuclease